MATEMEYRRRLKSLEERRSIPVDLSTDSKHVAKAFGREYIADVYRHRTDKDFSKYSLGCMEELPPRSTEISIEEGEKVKKQLANNLSSMGLYPAFEYQGSVPLNIHIEFSSDVDLLVLCGDVLTYSSNGPKAATYRPTSKTVLGAVKDLRGKCEKILSTVFYAAKVDCTGSKSIALTEGGFRRKVDVVPSGWFDSVEYQITDQKIDRIVQILDRDNDNLISNWPFKHIAMVIQKDVLTTGGCRKVIRLLKSLKRDSDLKINLSSYELSGLVWNFDDRLLRVPLEMEMSLVGNTFVGLNALLNNPSGLMELKTPDKSRFIIDSQDKVKALSNLRDEIRLLALRVAAENSGEAALADDRIGTAMGTIRIPTQTSLLTR